VSALLLFYRESAVFKVTAHLIIIWQVRCNAFTDFRPCASLFVSRGNLSVILSWAGKGRSNKYLDSSARYINGESTSFTSCDPSLT
jgi:hypothetical protein